jgi:general secretion pathway protein A
MYKEFYGFTTYPFALTPDTQFLYPSENYKDCLFYLLHGLQREYGILVMIGAIGTGKTFLLNTLIKKLDEKTHAAFIVNSTLNSFEILQYASKEFRLEITGQSKAELLLNLREFLLTHAMTNEKVVLIIDEAQNLSVEVLEELRLLTNFENADKKLIQIILSGQVQLEEKLKLPELTQLSQRVGFSCRLIPLNYEQTKDYIENRLAIAGVTEPLFTAKAIKEIYSHSKGIPRVINIICDLALLLGSIDGTCAIGPTIIQEVRQDLHVYTAEQLRRRHTRPHRDTDVVRACRFKRPRRLAWMAALAVVSLLGAGPSGTARW